MTIFIPLLLIIAFVLYFGRVSPRIIPDSGIVSPASGKIIDQFITTSPSIIFEKEGIQNTVIIPELGESAHVLLIELNLNDVHVQRAPIDSTIIRMDHYKGRHTNALGKKKKTIVETNEKTVTVFKNTTITIGVIQVAGKAARRIKNRVMINDSVTKGQVYGRILLGSQVVVIIPTTVELLTTIGQRVIDGETILANE